MTFSLPRTVTALALAGGIAGFAAPAAACGSDPFIGNICTVAFGFCPVGYAPADGSLMPIQQYQALYSLIGTTYGGDGQTTFALPDLRGRSPAGAGAGYTRLNTLILAQGQQAGSATVTLTPDNLPQHTHAATFTPTVNTMSVDVAQVPEPAVKTPVFTKDDRTIRVAAGTAQPGGASPGTVLTGGTVTVSPNPSPNTPVSIQSPVLALTFCIAIEGIYPMRP